MENPESVYLMNKALNLRQLPRGFKSSGDAVFLAASCPARGGSTVLDLGCGVGTAGLCLLKRVPDIHLTGIDKDKDAIALATENATLNALERNATFLQQDIADTGQPRYDHVICNPPFFKAGAHLISPDTGKAQARGYTDTTATLQNWVDSAFRALREKGSLSLIHRAEAIQDIMLALGKKFGGCELIPLWPKAGRQAKLMILRSYKNSHKPFIVYSGLVIHEEDGSYTRDAEKILRDGGGLYI